MEESAKKTLLIVVAVACIAAAGIITYKTMGGGTTAIGQPTSKMWVKCNNPKCGNEYQISAKEYTDFMMSNGGPRQFIMSGAVPMKCPKCNEDSVFKAMKCEKCGKVFFPGTVEGKAEDTCPGCGYSPSTAPAKKT
jgi:phage FluMu protein Com